MNDNCVLSSIMGDLNNDVLYVVVDACERTNDFWAHVLSYHCEVKDKDGVRRAISYLVENEQDTVLRDIMNSEQMYRHRLSPREAWK